MRSGVRLKPSTHIKGGRRFALCIMSNVSAQVKPQTLRQTSYCCKLILPQYDECLVCDRSALPSVGTLLLRPKRRTRGGKLG